MEDEMENEEIKFVCVWFIDNRIGPKPEIMAVDKVRGYDPNSKEKFYFVEYTTAAGEVVERAAQVCHPGISVEDVEEKMAEKRVIKTIKRESDVMPKVMERDRQGINDEDDERIEDDQVSEKTNLPKPRVLDSGDEKYLKNIAAEQVKPVYDQDVEVEPRQESPLDHEHDQNEKSGASSPSKSASLEKLQQSLLREEMLAKRIHVLEKQAEELKLKLSKDIVPAHCSEDEPESYGTKLLYASESKEIVEMPNAKIVANMNVPVENKDEEPKVLKVSSNKTPACKKLYFYNLETPDDLIEHDVQPLDMNQGEIENDVRKGRKLIEYGILEQKSVDIVERKNSDNTLPKTNVQSGVLNTEAYRAHCEKVFKGERLEREFKRWRPIIGSTCSTAFTHEKKKIEGAKKNALRLQKKEEKRKNKVEDDDANSDSESDSDSTSGSSSTSSDSDSGSSSA
ncbi:hypothetical protein QAD02_002787 [Eretmocerus hayati]|uniref:Uncharacterized protein n=1 Tax=Eretmocerus hayati TaxID=131215 RepID=A0ACC2NK04_9HYME|nr:hypothetical protein QAD02_002787 [Eretmocerus hayati]